jgi:hypothetical protein
MLFLVLLSGCRSSPENEYVIEVSGHRGLQFRGTYLVVTSDGKSSAQTVTGVTPARYKVRGRVVSGSFQKQTEKGHLRASIFWNETLIAEADTAADFGSVLVATPGVRAIPDKPDGAERR